MPCYHLVVRIPGADISLVHWSTGNSLKYLRKLASKLNGECETNFRLLAPEATAIIIDSDTRREVPQEYAVVLGDMEGFEFCGSFEDCQEYMETQPLDAKLCIKAAVKSEHGLVEIL